MSWLHRPPSLQATGSGRGWNAKRPAASRTQPFCPHSRRTLGSPPQDILPGISWQACLGHPRSIYTSWGCGFEVSKGQTREINKTNLSGDSPGWPLSRCIDKGDCELLMLPPLLQGPGMTGACHHNPSDRTQPPLCQLRHRPRPVSKLRGLSLMIEPKPMGKMVRGSDAWKERSQVTMEGGHTRLRSTMFKGPGLKLQWVWLGNQRTQ